MLTTDSDIPAYEQRVRDERMELITKIDALVKFCASKHYREVDFIHQELLNRQMSAMAEYSTILLMRIDQFETDRRRAQS